MEAKKIALEIIRIAKNEETIEKNYFDLDEDENLWIIERVKEVEAITKATIETEGNCAGCTDRDCLDAYIKISLYSLEQVNLVRNRTSNNNANEENNELKQKIEIQINQFKKISSKLAQIDFGIHDSTDNCATTR